MPDEVLPGPDRHRVHATGRAEEKLSRVETPY
jgi:hypothetical protein